MKFTVFSLSFARGSTAEEVISTAAEIGFDGVDLRAQPDGHIFTDASAERRRELLDYARARQMRIYGIMGYRGPRLFSQNEAEVEQELAGLQAELELAQDLEASYIRVFPGSNIEDRTEGNLERFIQSLRRLCPKAEALGLDIGIEIHPGLVWNAEICRRVVEGVGSNNLGIFYDPPLMVLYDRLDPVAEGAKMQDLIYSAHFKDYRISRYGHSPEYEWVPLGTGDVPIDEVLGFLKQIGFDRYVCVEYLKWWEEQAGGADRTLPAPEEVLPGELNYLRSRLL
jgi:sugar phosphate isomerase/epimerase